jgi:hypothetical protein
MVENGRKWSEIANARRGDWHPHATGSTVAATVY